MSNGLTAGMGLPQNFGVSAITIDADVPTDGTVDVPYPVNMGQDDFIGVKQASIGGNIVIVNNSNFYKGSNFVTFDYQPDKVVATNKKALPWKAGSTLLFQMPRKTVGESLLAIAPLADDADLVTTVAKVNEIIAAIRPPAPIPVVTALQPSSAQVGSADLTLSVQGEGFTVDTTILFNNLPELTTFVSSGEVTTGVKPSMFASPAEVPVGVQTGAKVSGTLPFTFTP